MKLYEYQKYESFTSITFINSVDETIEFTVRDSGITVECDGVSVSELKEAITIIESGKLEIEL
jgi:hypothetical protein